jgi:DNA polymerase-3 subunit epsilon
MDAARHAARFAWPRAALAAVALVPRGERDAIERSWLDRLLSRVPRPLNPDHDAYFATLERALFDGVLSRHEQDELLAVAHEVGLDRDAVMNAHWDYLVRAAAVALDDGVVTSGERDELRWLSAVLLLPDSAVDEALQFVHNGGHIPTPNETLAATFTLRPGDRVVFTGSMRRDRSEWELAATHAGLTIGGVTKNTRVVVAADPDSMSGKAAKARSYGVPVITEDAFIGMFTAYQQQQRRSIS